MRTSRAILRKAASTAFSNSSSSTSIESLTLLPSRGSTLVFIRVWQCTGAGPATREGPAGAGSATRGLPLDDGGVAPARAEDDHRHDEADRPHDDQDHA